MRKIILFLLTLVLPAAGSYAQTNIMSSSAVAEQILLGNYNPVTFKATNVLNSPDSISKGIMARVSPDSLHAYLNALRSFHNRNSGSDTTSAANGIGAARRWVYSKFQQFSSQNENRLLPSFLWFDLQICDIFRHNNVFAVLPGIDTTDKSVILVEAHLDSRCSGLCDTACLAEGMEDNGSGVALVLELARVMSRYSYNHTIVFIATTAEEQGLLGAEAFADYVQQKGIKVKAVLNNDVVGGIICGQTSSPPGCPGLNNIDSTQVRLFSDGGYNSPHKGLCRFIKLEYKEMIKPFAAIPMTVSIMTAEDRTGRGGDHIPFRQHGYTAMRFTSANEHGDASNGPGYTDRQHTSGDTLGMDTNNDNILDSFFVDFDYLARNTVINGNAAGMAGIGPQTPNFTAISNGTTDLTITVFDPKQYLDYRVGLRTTTNDWDTVFSFSGSTTHSFTIAPASYIVSVMSVDNNGTESIPSGEFPITTGIHDVSKEAPIVLMQNTSNPSDETTMISVMVNREVTYRDAFISITDISGREVKHLNTALKKGMNELIYDHGYNMSGIYTYTLVVDGKPLQSKRMVFTH